MPDVSLCNDASSLPLAVKAAMTCLTIVALLLVLLTTGVAPYRRERLLTRACVAFTVAFLIFLGVAVWTV